MRNSAGDGKQPVVARFGTHTWSGVMNGWVGPVVFDKFAPRRAVQPASIDRGQSGSVFRQCRRRTPTLGRRGRLPSRGSSRARSGRGPPRSKGHSPRLPVRKSGASGLAVATSNWDSLSMVTVSVVPDPTADSSITVRVRSIELGIQTCANAKIGATGKLPVSNTAATLSDVGSIAVTRPSWKSVNQRNCSPATGDRSVAPLMPSWRGRLR